MYRDRWPSQLLKNTVEELSSLPGVGSRSALRFALHLLRQPQENVERLGNSILRLRRESLYCRECNMISDTEVCKICNDSGRDRGCICVVESVRDVISIENTMQYNGLYHVLGGIISPMDGVGPSDLSISKLRERVQKEDVTEVFMALSTTMEGETTAYYLYRILQGTGVHISTIARGIGFGDELEYTDEVTLGRSIQNRQPFDPVNNK
ncbi:MAG: recombination mediator RecR [Bacteroidales bacterium]|jgi:recombination protein RecR|nr:recombination mediator RecR [Bacteroidales bacterium]MDD2425615.1 recombination mediator RecR [Bacteroidales bacterium]MDD3989757.1 recombination mediator RecR [Bacteroidales bacterium]